MPDANGEEAHSRLEYCLLQNEQCCRVSPLVSRQSAQPSKIASRSVPPTSFPLSLYADFFRIDESHRRCEAKRGHFRSLGGLVVLTGARDPRSYPVERY